MLVCFQVTPTFSQTDTVDYRNVSIPEKTVAGEFFIKGLCAALHSIYFDDKGNLYTGSLGDSAADFGKSGIKKIYKISPQKEITLAGEVKCVYITAVAVDNDENIYMATEEPTQILKISANGESTVLSETGTYGIRADSTGNIHYASNGKIYNISPQGEKIAEYEIEGLIDKRGDNIYNCTFGSHEITRYCVKANPVEKEVIALPVVVKGPVMNETTGSIYVKAYDNGDCLVKMEEGRPVERINIDIDIPFSRIPRQYVLNAAAFGKAEFGSDYLYIVTGTGDIVRIKVE